MKKSYLVLVAAAVLFTATTAYAAEFRFAHEKNDTNVSIPASETHKNLYAVGGSIDINGNTQGDLIAAGGMVSVSGNVEQDLTVFGGNLNLNGPVGGDLRTAGGNISIGGPIGSDLLVAGGNVTVAQKATVAGDLVAGVGNLTLDSEVKGKTQIFGGQVTINGKIDGDLFVRATKSLVFGPDSQVAGKITYEGVMPAVVNTGAKIGPIEYTKIENPQSPAHAVAGLFAFTTFIKLLGLLIAGLILYWLFPRKIEAVVAHAHEKTLKSFWIGLLVLIVPPILALILCITVVGFYLGAIIFLAYLLLQILASIFMLFYSGNLLMKWFKKPVSVWWDLVIGTIALIILYAIPVVGWIAAGILYIISLGSLYLHLKDTNPPAPVL